MSTQITFIPEFDEKMGMFKLLNSHDENMYWQLNLFHSRYQGSNESVSETKAALVSGAEIEPQVGIDGGLRDDTNWFRTGSDSLQAHEENFARIVE